MLMKKRYTRRNTNTANEWFYEMQSSTYAPLKKNNKKKSLFVIILFYQLKKKTTIYKPSKEIVWNIAVVLKCEKIKQFCIFAGKYFVTNKMFCVSLFFLYDSSLPLFLHYPTF